MKFFTSSCTFDYSWEEVSIAIWQKYGPWNDKSTHVISVDTLSRHFDLATGILRTERLLTCKQTAPKWLCTLTGMPDVTQSFEISYVEPKSQKLTMVSSNLTLAKIISVQEEVIYTPISGTKTKFEQVAKITALCGGWQNIKTKIEEAGIHTYHENARKGKEGFEAVLEMSRRVFGEEKWKQQLRAAREERTEGTMVA